MKKLQQILAATLIGCALLCGTVLADDGQIGSPSLPYPLCGQIGSPSCSVTDDPEGTPVSSEPITEIIDTILALI